MVENQKPPAIFLMGPTACGKTDVAVALRDSLPVEIISVDSALVYRGMDIGTAKPEPRVLENVPHRLIDIRDPAEPYSAAEFARDARACMAEIAAGGRIPLLVGGTMLYFRALLEGLAELPSADAALRLEIESAARRHGWPHLHRQLAEVDPEAAAAIHPNHSRRIQRALEVYRLTGRPMSQLRRERGGSPPLEQDYRIAQLALMPRDRGVLHHRIERRFHRMLEQGLIEEVKALAGRGDLAADLPAIRAVGYRQVWEYLAGETDYRTMVEKGVAATRQLAKRQFTWLRKWPGLIVVYTDKEDGSLSSVQEITTNCLKKLGNTPIYIH